MLQRTSQLELQWTNFTISLFYGLVSLLKFTTTKEENSRINCSIEVVEYIIFGTKPTGFSSYTNYVKKWRSAMKEAYDLAAKRSHQSNTRGKMYYNKNANSAVLQPGDRVLVHNLRERGGPGKLRSH